MLEPVSSPDYRDLMQCTSNCNVVMSMLSTNVSVRNNITLWCLGQPLWVVKGVSLLCLCLLSRKIDKILKLEGVNKNEVPS